MKRKRIAVIAALTLIGLPFVVYALYQLQQIVAPFSGTEYLSDGTVRNYRYYYAYNNSVMRMKWGYGMFKRVHKNTSSNKTLKQTATNE